MTAPGIHETKLAREQRWQAFVRAAQDGDNVPYARLLSEIFRCRAGWSPTNGQAPPT